MRSKLVGSLIIFGLITSPPLVLASSYPLSNIYQLAFQVYRKAVNLAYTRELTPDQREELERIHEEQPNIVLESIRGILGEVSQNGYDVEEGSIGIVLLNGPLNETQTRRLEVSLIEKHLYFTKQIILLLDLSPADLGILDRSIEAQKIRFEFSLNFLSQVISVSQSWIFYG